MSDDYKISGSLDDVIITSIDNLDFSNNMGTTGISSLDYGTITIGNGSSGMYTTNSTYSSYNSPYTITGIDTSNSFKVEGDAEFNGDIKVNGKSLNKFMETLEKRLAILQPDPEKLEKFEALKKAYDHYKTLEALCEIQKEEDED